jgi:hypothetical protein
MMNSFPLTPLTSDQSNQEPVAATTQEPNCSAGAGRDRCGIKTDNAVIAVTGECFVGNSASTAQVKFFAQSGNEQISVCPPVPSDVGAADEKAK